MMILLGALALAAILAPTLVRVCGRPAFGLLALVPGSGFLWILSLFFSGTFTQGGHITTQISWLPQFHLDLNFRLDSLAALFSLIILGIGALVLLYCWGYFDSNPLRLSLFGGQMVAFATAMFGLVTSNSLLLMYIFWEITSVLSFLLVGYYGERASSRRSAGQALMITALGGLVMLVGIVLLGRQTGIWLLSDIPLYQHWEFTPRIAAAVALILCGAISKSAIAPAHFWLPGAMAAPTPVSAYLHSAAMVKAGIYLVARLAPDFNVVASWHVVLIPLGVFTMLLGGWMALKQRDLKLILAYGTVSQLGFIISVMAIGSAEAIQAGLALTFAHSLFKATLFMVVGAIDHSTGTRDITQLAGLGRAQPLLSTCAALAAASMAGIPLLFGFIAKETALDAVLHETLLTGMPGNLMLVGLVLGSMLTMAYSLYFLYGAFAKKGQEEPSDAVKNLHPAGPLLWLPPAVLTVLSLGFGLYPRPLSLGLDAHLGSVFPQQTTHTLALWHGFNIPLLLSAVIIAGGAIMFWQRDFLRRFQFELPGLGSADSAYDATLDFLRNLSLRITASTQRGSLTINLGIIFLVLSLLPLSALILGHRPEVRMMLWDTPWQSVLALTIVVVSIGAAVSQNRLSGVILVGVTGYCMAMIFALHGAPDLALTQTLVETIVMVVFMLVLRKLPTEAQWRGEPRSNRARAWLSILVGVCVTTLALHAISSRVEQPIATDIPTLAKDIGHGDNAVNVLLVDIRSWDTFGEITVLVIAAIGVASLIYRGQSFARPSRRPTLRVANRRWLAGQVGGEKVRNRSLMVDVATRLLFPAMMVLSIYFFFAGHNAPGGGFAGGLVAALAFTLRYLAGGREELEEALPIDAGKLLGSGLIISALAAIWPMTLGYPPLTSKVWDVELPLIGDLHIASALLFDLGVYLIVIGLILHILRSLGGQLDRDEEMRRQRARDRAKSMRQEGELNRGR
ncbi:Na+/H+ antiporter subunit A [Corynebacterium poyangense]|uniref:Na+/H+ antiporter subunit A n=1 Tax=Corynebacterium poyangense TaxID=2684405 RepID=A0A7H0SRA5_9CORY|nr:Na+/H+ antiporter subunit A [Corynebacterium poyangense]MBZ8176512.1 Na+/H+ antiporter subunit A [Corynebacterium poyangense]QNQ91080.1 Na+/H+ antiporter subunit A [Corynebacterium poyangense]